MLTAAAESIDIVECAWHHVTFFFILPPPLRGGLGENSKLKRMTADGIVSKRVKV